jgi:DNA adenine methylase
LEIKYLVRWVGGKNRLIPEIDKRIPKNINAQYDTYVEPFVGGGSVMFHILNNYNFKKIYVNDKNKELINLYLSIKNFPKEMVDKIEKLDLKYLSLDVSKKKEMYHLIRKNYNRIKLKDEKINIEKANLLMFLMRMCFNGVYRVNKKGEFNTSIGSFLTRSFRKITKEEIFAISEQLENVNFFSEDFSELENLISNKTFFYLDPPYLPETDKQEHIRYTPDGFSIDEQKRLKEFIDKINLKGGKFILSNSDTENGFFYDLYKEYVIDKVKIKRLISGKNEFRKEITELMIKNF